MPVISPLVVVLYILNAVVGAVCLFKIRWPSKFAGDRTLKYFPRAATTASPLHIIFFNYFYYRYTPGSGLQSGFFFLCLLQSADYV